MHGEWTVFDILVYQMLANSCSKYFSGIETQEATKTFMQWCDVMSTFSQSASYCEWYGPAWTQFSTTFCSFAYFTFKIDAFLFLSVLFSLVWSGRGSVVKMWSHNSLHQSEVSNICKISWALWDCFLMLSRSTVFGPDSDPILILTKQLKTSNVDWIWHIETATVATKFGKPYFSGATWSKYWRSWFKALQLIGLK